MIGTAAYWALHQDAFARDKTAWAIVSNQPAYQPSLIKPVPVEGGALGLLQQLTQTRADKPAPTVAEAQTVPDEKGLRSFSTLTSFYSVTTPMAVESFLQEHKQLPKLLFSAFPRIKSVWGAHANPELTVVDDPEGGFPMLTVRLNSNAYEALDRFDEEWWLDHIGEAEGLLNFTLHAK